MTSNYFDVTEDALDSWAKMAEDMSKVAFIAVVPSLLVEKNLEERIISSLGLTLLAITLLFLGLFLRNVRKNRLGGKQ